MNKDKQQEVIDYCFPMKKQNERNAGRKKVLERLFGFKIPFAMLINEAGLFDSKKRYELLKNNPFEIMVFDKRIDYIKDEEMLKGVPFKSIFLCSNVLPTQFTFEVLS